MKDVELTIRIANLSEVAGSFRLDEREVARCEAAQTDVGVACSFTHNAEHPDMLGLRVTATYTAQRNLIRRHLMDLAVEAVFDIPSLSRNVAFSADGRDIDIPPVLAAQLLSIAIGALRGMIALRTAGTPLQGRPLPLIDISALVSRLRYRSPNPESYFKF